MAEKWQITGEYFESCNCETACPCIFLSSPTEGECTALVGWHIGEGRSGDIDLGGLSVALAVYCPGNMAEVPWQVALYLDDQASAEQQGALAEIFSGQAGGHFAAIGQHIGKVLGAAVVPIDYKADGRKRSMKIGSVGAVAIEAMAGQGGAEVTIGGHPLAVAPGFPVSVGHSSALEYHDYGMNWELAGKNSFQSPFRYDGP